ncbi:hypothetical protein C8R45DRAFT_921931 [Mycena sanguinolenta]|nr:hypothetical protein C8R45DRAFT_921931 [Mycena sanguinolenta]
MALALALKVYAGVCGAVAVCERWILRAAANGSLRGDAPLSSMTTSDVPAWAPARFWGLGLLKIPGQAAPARPGSASAWLWPRPGLLVKFFEKVVLSETGWLATLAACSCILNHPMDTNELFYTLKLYI